MDSEDTSQPTASRRSAVLGSLAVGLLALVVLLLAAGRFQPDRLYVYELNDQVGYVTTARWLADHGELRSQLVVPSFVENASWRMYMPGHYAALATSYALFGDGPIQWRLPSLVGFVITAVGTFLIGRRLYGVLPGLLAAAIVILFPANVSDAFTAMSEATIGAACVLSFCVFLHLPSRNRYVLGPLLLALPFLFRETGALLLVPMALVAWADRSVPRLRSLAILAGGSVVVIAAIYAWQTGTGKQSPPLSWIVLGRVNFGDAVLEETLPSPTLPELASGLWTNFTANLGFVQERFRTRFASHSEPALTSTVLGFVLIALAVGVARVRRDPYPLGAGLLGLAAVTFLMFFHKAYIHVAIRHIVFTLPFTAVVVGAILARVGAWGAASGWGLGKVGTGVLVVLAVPFLWLCNTGIQKRVAETCKETPAVFTEELEFFGHDDAKLLVCLPVHGLRYVLDHYPVRWSFVPENDETLRRLAERHEIGTLILAKEDLGRTLTRRGIRDAGLFEIGSYQNRFQVYMDRESAMRLRRKMQREGGGAPGNGDGER